MTRRFLLDRPLTEDDLAEMRKWLALYQFEVQRVVNVLANWKKEKEQ